MIPLVPQSGIGIEFRNGNFHAIYCKRFWKGLREMDRLEIPEYQTRSAAECGKIYREFLRRNGLKAPWTVVALPRSHVLLRMVRFPRAMEKELGSAVEYQLDTLHPFEEGSVVHDHSIWNLGAQANQTLPGESSAATDPLGIQVLVAIAQRQYIEAQADWFRQAEIPVSQFSPTTTLLLGYLAAAISTRISSGGSYFLAHATEEGIELISCAAEMGFVSRGIPLSPDTAPEDGEILHLLSRELDWACSAMRLNPEDRPQVQWCGRAILPSPASGSGNLPFQILPLAGDVSDGERIVGMAAAFAAVHRRSPLSLNLLPEINRSYESRLSSVPTYALAALVVLLAVVMGLRGSVQDWTYSRYLEKQRQALLPEIQELEKLQQANQETMAHLTTLSTSRRSGAFPLDLLEELTRTLPADAWLQQLQYEGSTVTLSGTAASASAVLQAVSTSNYLEAAQFTAALNRTPEGKEVFRIGARLRVPNP
ncbi:MAG: PilN domain-containing protein [Acidobacteria bacterium]|nr:PilN domain-containing protein [Acidobacteriota bacterium]